MEARPVHTATNEQISHYPAGARLNTDKQLKLAEWNSRYPTGARLEQKERPMATNQRICRYPTGAWHEEERHTQTDTDKQLQLPERNTRYPTGARFKEEERPTATNEWICPHPARARLKEERPAHTATEKQLQLPEPLPQGSRRKRGQRPQTNGSAATPQRQGSKRRGTRTQTLTNNSSYRNGTPSTPPRRGSKRKRGQRPQTIGSAVTPRGRGSKRRGARTRTLTNNSSYRNGSPATGEA